MLQKDLGLESFNNKNEESVVETKLLNTGEQSHEESRYLINLLDTSSNSKKQVNQQKYLTPNPVV